MDAFDFGSEKIENRVILIFHSFKSITKLFRIVEFCVGVFVLLWSSTRLPFAVKISGEYFRQLISIILSPLFIFLICNVIVLTLLFKSGRLFGDSSSTLCASAEAELYDSFVEKEECSGNFTAGNSSSPPEPEEIVYQDKQTVLEVNTRTIFEPEETETVTEKAFYSQVPRRTKSEKFERGSYNKEISGNKLRRSETERCRKIDNSGDPSETVYPVDELSNEEFQKAIEDFIAKQIKFHQEEKLAIVLHSQA
ncbi:uncharacterized protein LOC107766154 [Nicotiana tabacum]|uniref:uncharacterized protein LOC107766154 n=1 Tax=Nicotiana tabacum TaxID=4097 RepID=UPI003F4E5A68